MRMRPATVSKLLRRALTAWFSKAAVNSKLLPLQHENEVAGTQTSTSK